MRRTIVILLLLLGLVPRAEAALRSPWDTAVPAVTEVAYACPKLASLPRDIASDDYYSDPRHSVIDPARYAAYQAAQAAFQQVMTATAKAADSYRQTGSGPAARCALGLLEAQAGAAAMTGRMSSNQSSYLQGWTIGALAIGYLKVRGIATPAQAAAISAWLMRVAHDTQSYMDSRRLGPRNTDARNNHYYWAGLAVMAAGVAGDSQAMFDWGLGTYRDGIGRITPEGTLPLEMARGGKALHYHLFAATPLVAMAEFGAANGIDLYAEDNGALHLLMARCLSGLQDNSFFAAQAHAPQDAPEPGRTLAAQLNWAWPYARRFPDSGYAKIDQKAMRTGSLYLGGLPSG